MDELEKALVVQHLDLVGHVVRRLGAQLPAHVDRAELVSAGVIGLVEAASTFDAARGVPFGAFAVRRVRGAVLDAMRHEDPASRSTRALQRRLEAVDHELTTRWGRHPTTAELAAELGVPSEALDRVRTAVAAASLVALDAPAEGSHGEPHHLGIEDRGAVDPLAALEAVDDLDALRRAVTALPDRHRQVITGYFLEGRTSAELAGRLGVTESRISQVRSAALRMLREGLAAQLDGEAPAPPAVTPRRPVRRGSAVRPVRADAPSRRGA